MGTYDITLSGGMDNNYAYSYVSGSLTVNKASLVATANDDSRTYGAANPAFTISYTGFVNSDTKAELNTEPASTSTVSATSNVGTYDITLSGGTDNNYTYGTLNSGTLTITKASLTATADNKSKIYNEANPALTVSYSGFMNSETALVLTTVPTATTTAITGSDAGTYAITVSGGVDDNYSFSYVAGELTINKKDQTISITAIANKDISDAPFGVTANTGSGLTLSYAIQSGPATISGTTITLSGTTGTVVVAVNQAGDINYNAATQTTESFIVTDASKTDQTITFSALTNKTYGDADFNLSATASSSLGVVYNVVSGDATISGSTVSITGAGTVTIEANQTGDATYNPAPSVQQSFTVNKASLTVTAADKSKTYGATNPSFTVDYTGFVNSETKVELDTEPTATSTANISSDAGAYTITVSDGTDNNYAYSYVSGSLTVNKATLTATAADKSKTYGDANPSFTVSYTGFMNSETKAELDTEPTATSTANTSSAAGAYTITVSGGTDNNYIYSYVSGSFTVNKASLVATANDDSRAYGSANPAFTISYTGFVNSDTKAELDTEPTVTSTASATSNVGTYPISLSGGTDNNYIFGVLNNGNLSITKAELIVTADNKSKIYNEANPALTFVYSGFMNNETASVLTTVPTATTTATTGSDAGTYAITVSGGVDDNYSFSYVAGELIINKKDQTIEITTIADKDVSNTPFGVTANTTSGLALSYAIQSGPATISGITITLSGTTGTVVVAVNQAGNTNYNAATQVTESFTVTDASKTNQTITFSTLANKTYGDADFNLSATASSSLGVVYNVVSGDATISGNTITITGVGTVIIEANQTGDATYNPAPSVQQSFTVNKASLTVTAADKSKTYGDENPVLTFNYSGFVNSETSTVLETKPMVSTVATTSSDAGTYAITVLGGVDDNYSFTYVSGIFIVNKANQTISVTIIADKDISDVPFDVIANTTSGLALTYAIQSGPATISGTTITLNGTTGTVVVAVDQAGNTNYNAATLITESFAVTMTDVTAPVPDEATLSGLTGECSVDKPAAPTATDNVDGTVVGTTTTVFPVTESTVITWTYTDAANNKSTQEQTVTVSDQTNPTITCMDNQTISLSEGETVYTIMGTEFDPIANDNCSLASMMNDFNNSSTLADAQLPEGETTIVWTATDATGNTETCSFTVTVEGTVSSILKLTTAGIAVYPNPTSDVLTINFADKQIQRIIILDLNGKIIIDKTEVKNIETIDLSNFNYGVYLLNIQTDKGIISTKIIKQ